jgi:type I restriction enzyme S subunit
LLSSRFVSLYLNLDVIRQYFESFSVGSTLDNLNSELLQSMPVIVPPCEEQEKIADDVEAEVARHEQLADLMRRQVNAMTARRDALITSAVTGQLDPTSYRSEALAR